MAESDMPTNETTTQQRVDEISEAISGTHIDAQDDNDDHSFKEVWAAESDPSDYDYGEGLPDLSQQQLQFQEDDWLDPHNLSKADSSLTHDQARLAVGSLLKEANYNVLEPIFSLSKKEVETYMAEITQLTLMLLQPQNILGNKSDGSMDSAIQDAILSPLWVQRDAAIHALNLQQRQSFTTSYLDVLQTLLAVDQAHLKDLGGLTTNQNVELCTASIVGLSALSSWCTMPEILTQLTITSVLDSMNDISHVVDRAMEKYKDNLSHSLIPIMELLSGIGFDKAKANAISNSNSIQQTLLSSGFLRQLLVLASEGDHQKTRHFYHALWGLSVAYPKIVGKYVARYPSTPQLIRQYNVTPESSSQDFVASILWNGFGWSQFQDAGQQAAPRVVWKSSSATSVPPLSKDECEEVCQKSWTLLCQVVGNCISNSLKEPEKAAESLSDWERLLSFISIPSMATTFVQLLDKSLLQDISKALSTVLQQQQQQQPEEETTEKSNDNADPDDKLKSPNTNRQLITSNARKLIKQYTLFFQGNTGGSSKTD